MFASVVLPSIRARAFGIALCTALAVTLPAAPVQAQWKPERAVEVVVGFAPGGGNDKSARILQKIWKETGLVDAVVVNKVGGGGALAYTYVSQKAGDGQYLAIAQAGINTNHITGRSPLHYSAPRCS